MVTTSEIAYISGIHFQVLIRSALMILTFSEIKIHHGLDEILVLMASMCWSL